MSPPPPINDDRIDSDILEHLKANRSRAGDNLRIIEGVDENIAFFESASSRARPYASSNTLPNRSTSAPCPAVWVTFTVGVGSGITIVAEFRAFGRGKRPPERGCRRTRQ